MVKIKTYIYNGKPNEVNKTLQENEEYTGVLNATFNVLTPVVRFRTRTPVTFNYVYIESLPQIALNRRKVAQLLVYRVRVSVV